MRLSSAVRVLTGLLLFIIFAASSTAEQTKPEITNDVAANVDILFTPWTERRHEVLQWMRDRGETDVVPALIYALRYVASDRDQIVDTLRQLTSHDEHDNWFEWMSWQQRHSEIMPFRGFDKFQADLFATIDPNFRMFLHEGIKHEIRLEEINWGGVAKDGIPALTNPDFIPVTKAGYLTDDEPVFGVEINGDVRAYPYRIMDWHEMANDVVGGVPVSLAYCTLCGSGILFDTRLEHGDPLVFGSSGFLYRSNKLMYDTKTNSLWNQFTGRPVVGKLTGSRIELQVLPLVTTTWKQWRTNHPGTKVLSPVTGYSRDYTPGRPYGTYFATDALMFPAPVNDKQLKPKDQVFGLRISGNEKAWPLHAFAGGKVLNDRIGAIDIVLIGEAATRTVRAYRAGANTFRISGPELNTIVSGDGRHWSVTEAKLISKKGETLPRLPGHLAYWFAWSGYLDTAEFYDSEN